MEEGLAEGYATEVSEGGAGSDAEGASVLLREEEPRPRSSPGKDPGLTRRQLLQRRLDAIRVLQRVYEGQLQRHTEQLGGAEAQAAGERPRNGKAPGGGDLRPAHSPLKRASSFRLALRAKLPRISALEEIAGGSMTREMERQGALLCLWGDRVRYLVRRTAATLGRRCGPGSTAQQVDVDLALAGPAGRVSREQGRLALHPSGAFALTNTGRRPLCVNNTQAHTCAQVARGEVAELGHLSLLEVAGLRFLVLLNPGAIQRACAPAAPQRSASLWGR